MLHSADFASLKKNKNPREVWLGSSSSVKKSLRPGICASFGIRCIVSLLVYSSKGVLDAKDAQEDGRANSRSNHYGYRGQEEFIIYWRIYPTF